MRWTSGEDKKLEASPWEARSVCGHLWRPEAVQRRLVLRSTDFWGLLIHHNVFASCLFIVPNSFSWCIFLSSSYSWKKSCNKVPEKEKITGGTFSQNSISWIYLSWDMYTLVWLAMPEDVFVVFQKKGLYSLIIMALDKILRHQKT